MTTQEAQKLFDLLQKHYPHAHIVLDFSNHFELLVAIILSAQCTDKKVNEVTALLFPKFKKERSELKQTYATYEKTVKLPHDELVQIVNFAFTPLHELEQDIKQTGFYHNKANNVQKAAKVVLDTFHGILPKTITEMTTIPGVGRKTANVFLSNAYHIDEGIAVDTHVMKQSQLLGLSKNKTPEKIEQDLMALFPQSQWHQLTYMLIEHGRNKRMAKAKQIRCNDPSCILCA